MQEHGLARGAVRKAVEALEEEGLVSRVQGRGPSSGGDSQSDVGMLSKSQGAASLVS